VSTECLADGQRRDAFFFDVTQLFKHAALVRDSFFNAQPFPHVVMDDFLSGDVADRLLKTIRHPTNSIRKSTTAESREDIWRQ
jgi:hypothetical protein